MTDLADRIRAALPPEPFDPRHQWMSVEIVNAIHDDIRRILDEHAASRPRPADSETP